MRELLAQRVDAFDGRELRLLLPIESPEAFDGGQPRRRPEEDRIRLVQTVAEAR